MFAPALVRTIFRYEFTERGHHGERGYEMECVEF